MTPSIPPESRPWSGDVRFLGLEVRSTSDSRRHWARSTKTGCDPKRPNAAFCDFAGWYQKSGIASLKCGHGRQANNHQGAILGRPEQLRHFRKDRCETEHQDGTDGAARERGDGGDRTRPAGAAYIRILGDMYAKPE